MYVFLERTLGVTDVLVGWMTVAGVRILLPFPGVAGDLLREGVEAFLDSSANWIPWLLED